MLKKEKSAAIVKEYAHELRCPICHLSVEVVNVSSLTCENNHSFDFAKQGYVNLLVRSSQSNYDKSLFEARRDIIVNSDLYIPLHEHVAQLIKETVPVSNDSSIVLDAGCGEGSHLHSILRHCTEERFVGVGLDIAKEGVRKASGAYEGNIWFVADLANIPLANDSCSIILNILSPANYSEFKRILARGGLVIKVVPSSNYLVELREYLFQDNEKTDYENERVVSLFKQQFELVDEKRLTYSMELKPNQLKNIVHMSPLTWNATEEQVERFIYQSPSRITVDLVVMVGSNFRTEGGNE